MKALIGPLAGLAMLGLTSCATGPNGVVTVDPNFIASVQSISATACSVIPTVESIIAIFNAGIATTVAAVSSAVCHASPPPASARFLALPLRASGQPAATLGVVGNVNVTGWRAGQVVFGRHRR